MSSNVLCTKHASCLLIYTTAHEASLSPHGLHVETEAWSLQVGGPRVQLVSPYHTAGLYLGTHFSDSIAIHPLSHTVGLSLRVRVSRWVSLPITFWAT